MTEPPSPTPRCPPPPPPALGSDGHKGLAGRCLCFAGSRQMPGAALLVARAAQRAGAGLVRMACLDEGLLTILPVGAPEAVLLDLSGSRLESTDLACLDEHARLAGPGFGQTPRARRMVATLLGSPRPSPLVLDADALNLVAGTPEALRDCTAPRLLTPHPGEARRLLESEIPGDDAGRLECARRLAQRTASVVCLKGHHTVVTDGERSYVNRSGNPGLATAGSGDVLAGILVAYLARAQCVAGPQGTPDLFDVACAGVYVHGRAADLVAQRLGERALVASDVIEALGPAQREVDPSGPTAP